MENLLSSHVSQSLSIFLRQHGPSLPSAPRSLLDGRSPELPQLSLIMALSVLDQTGRSHPQRRIPMRADDLIALLHQPYGWPIDDPKLEENTDPPDELIGAQLVNPM